MSVLKVLGAVMALSVGYYLKLGIEHLLVCVVAMFCYEKLTTKDENHRKKQ